MVALLHYIHNYDQHFDKVHYSPLRLNIKRDEISLKTRDREAMERAEREKIPGDGVTRPHSSGLIVRTPSALNKDGEEDWLSDKWMYKSPRLLCCY